MVSCSLTLAISLIFSEIIKHFHVILITHFTNRRQSLVCRRHTLLLYNHFKIHLDQIVGLAQVYDLAVECERLATKDVTGCFIA